jgi:hypothetical protein
MSKADNKRDRKFILILVSAMAVFLVVVGVLAPSSAQNDPLPTTTNVGPAGAKAAYLLLTKMGRQTARWDRPLSELGEADAATTTLVLAQPFYDPTQAKALKEAVKSFLERGGRVLATDATGALLLPDAEVKPSKLYDAYLCETTPEGPGPLARVGPVEMHDVVHWSTDGSAGSKVRVEQMCRNDAVVVRYAVGKGEAVWWASADPLTNAGLKRDGNLGLLLASVGDGRSVLFDESLHSEIADMWERMKGLPLTWLKVQLGIIAALLIFSFSRRSGPVRGMVSLPRSSPVEFANSMGDLYERAGATSAATEATKRRLLKMLVREAGVSQTAVAAGPDGVVEALRQRLGGDWQRVAEHLREAELARTAVVSPKSALTLVKAMNEDMDAIRAKLRPEAMAVVV